MRFDGCALYVGVRAGTVMGGLALKGVNRYQSELVSVILRPNGYVNASAKRVLASTADLSYSNLGALGF